MSRRSTFLTGIRTGSGPAFTLGERILTRSELWSKACGYADFLIERGIKPGDCVGVHLTDGLHIAIALVGHYLLGVVHAPINPRSTEHEVQHYVTEGSIVGIVSDGAPSAQVPIWAFDFKNESEREPGLREDEDVALILFTSGTTGKSKAVELSYRAVLSNIDALTTLWRWTPEDVLVLSLPLFHVHGLGIGIHGVLLRGCEAIIQDGFDAERVVEAFKFRLDTSIFMGVPTMYSRLVAHLQSDPTGAKALGRGRLFTSGSAALGVEVFDKFKELTGHTILERYGMSETMLTLSNPYDDRRRGSVGAPVGDTEVQIVDDGKPCPDGEPGELWVRGSSLMKGYRGRPEATAAAFTEGWFRTGDIVSREDGYISIHGRDSTDIIKSGGFKIGAREIEEVLMLDPDVVEIAVLGVPDNDLGERVVAAVVLRGVVGRNEVLDRLQALSRQHLSAYKTLRDVVLLDELPRNPMGKVQKFLLRAHFAQRS